MEKNCLFFYNKYSHGFLMALIEIDGLPFLKMGGFSMANFK